jgi:hypothetical protein
MLSWCEWRIGVFSGNARAGQTLPELDTPPTGLFASQPGKKKKLLVNSVCMQIHKWNYTYIHMYNFLNYSHAIQTSSTNVDDIFRVILD